MKYAVEMLKIAFIKQKINVNNFDQNLFFFEKFLIKLLFKKVASGSHDGTIKIWDQTTGDLLYTYSEIEKCQVKILERINCSVLAYGTNCSVIRLLDLNSGIIIKNLTGHTSTIKTLKLFNSSILISGSEDKTIRMWNLESTQNNQVKTITESFVILTLIVISNNLIACGLESENNIGIWNMNSNTKIQNLYHGVDVYSLVLLSDRQLLASGDCTTYIKLWNINNWSLNTTINSGGFRMIRFSNNILVFLMSSYSLYVPYGLNSLNLTNYAIRKSTNFEKFTALDLLDNNLITTANESTYEIKLWIYNNYNSPFKRLKSHSDKITSFSIVDTYPNPVTVTSQ